MRCRGIFVLCVYDIINCDKFFFFYIIAMLYRFFKIISYDLLWSNLILIISVQLYRKYLFVLPKFHKKIISIKIIFLYWMKILLLFLYILKPNLELNGLPYVLNWWVKWAAIRNANGIRCLRKHPREECQVRKFRK